MNPILIKVVGIIGIISGLCYRIPQIYKIYKTKSAEDISTGMLIIQNISYVAYIIYGFLVLDWIYITSSLISFLQNLIIYSMRRYYSLTVNEDELTS